MGELLSGKSLASEIRAISDFTATTKRAADDEESELTKDSGWGRNRNSPALGRQETVPKKSKN